MLFFVFCRPYLGIYTDDCANVYIKYIIYSSFMRHPVECMMTDNGLALIDPQFTDQTCSVYCYLFLG